MEISNEVFINSMNDINKYFQIMLDNKDKKIADLQSQLDQQKARIEELEGQFAYECECNKQFVQLQNMWNELKEWLEKKKSWNERQLKEAPINTEFYIRVSVQGITINKILEQMQELEAEDE